MPPKGISVALDRTLLERADALLPYFRKNVPSWMKYAKLSRVSIVNIALERGLQRLEEEISLMNSEDAPPISPTAWRKAHGPDEP